MIQDNFKVEILTDEEPNLSICKDYWKITDDLEYAYQVKSLAQKHDSYQNRISQIVQSSAVLTIHCQKCDCKIKTCKKRSDFELATYKDLDEILCEDCLSDKQKLESAAIIEDKLEAMEIAVETEKFKDLNEMELETLIEISESRTKKEVVQKVFKGADLHGDYAQKIWKRINLLDDMNLIWVEREKGGSSIVNYHTNSRLRQKLRTEYSDLFLPINEEEPHQFRKFQFTMIENCSKKDLQPDYSGFFKVKEEVILRPGKEYSYGAWKNDDGTMFIRIEPTEHINSDKYNLDDLTTPF